MQYEKVRDYSKEGMDAALKAFGAVSQGAQAITVEATDFAKRSLEQGTAAFEKLTAAKSLDKVVEIQTEYARTAYEGLVAQAGKMGTLYADLAKDTMKPFEAFTAGRTA
jgi:hypothetical protein